MAADEPAKSKAAAFFTRYEVVAVAVPGGVLLFGLLALVHHLPLPRGLCALVPDTIEIAKIDLGSLGLFTVAAFCAGQVIQALAAAFEWGVLSLVWRYGPTFSELGAHVRSELQNDERGKQPEAELAHTYPNLALPRPFGQIYALLLARITNLEPDNLTRREYLTQVLPFVLARLYRAGVSDRLLDLRVSWGLHRGLAVTFFIFTTLFVYRVHHDGDRWFSVPGGLAVLALGMMVAMALNAQRYRVQYYKQVAFEYIDLEKAWECPEV